MKNNKLVRGVKTNWGWKHVVRLSDVVKREVPVLRVIIGKSYK